MADGRFKTTRAAIHAAALQLFVEDGFDATTMSGIAAASGVSRRSLYRYFPDKEAVFFDFHEQETEALETLLAASSPVDLVATLRSFAQLLTADEEMLRLRVQVLLHTPQLIGRGLQRRADWERRVAESLARSAGVAPPTLEMKVMAAVGMAALYTAVRHVVYEGAPSDPAVAEALRLVEPIVSQGGVPGGRQGQAGRDGTLCQLPH